MSVEWWIYGLAGLFGMAILLLIVVLFALRVTVRYQLDRPGSMLDPGFVVTLEALTNSPRASVHDLKLYTKVEAIYEEMLAAIANAQHSITFETYLYWEGKMADTFGAAFKERVKAGVSVRLLLDADGTRFLPRAYMNDLREAGVEIQLFRPFIWYRPIQYNHRTHRKILVVDGKIGYTGGIGIADMWLGPPDWLDLMVRFEGGIVSLLQGAFYQNWVIAGGGLDMSERYFPRIESPGEHKGMVTTSSPIWGDSSMRLLYFSAIASAQKRILLASPYFLPNWDTAAALAAAAARGVDVRLLLVGPSNDKKLPYYASRRLYGQLLAAGVRLYEYLPAMMHAKAMVVDGRWVTVGSTNFDPRSFFLNSELNTSIDDPTLAADVEAFFETAFYDSAEITYEMWQARGWGEHFLGWIGLMFKDQL
jgi:cardiolipin synthase